MSEQSNSTFEAYRYPADTALFRSGEQIDLHAGNRLPSKEEGLEKARQTVEAALGGEQREKPAASGQLSIATWAHRTTDLRAITELVANGGSDEGFTFRTVRPDFERNPPRVETRVSMADSPNVNPLSTQTDMMGYELTSSGR